MFDINKLNVHDDIWSEIENSKGTFEKELYNGATRCNMKSIA